MEDPTCVCGQGPQSADHITWECSLVRQERDRLKSAIVKTGGIWPPNKSDLVDKYLDLFAKFANSINFDTL